MLWKSYEKIGRYWNRNSRTSNDWRVGIFSKISYLLFSLILPNVLKIDINIKYIVSENNIFKLCHSQAQQLADNLSE